MSEIKTFFRFCPECGRRFHIKLVSKNLINVEREKEEVARTITQPPASPYPFPTAVPVIVQEGEPITIDVEEFQYVYRCGHCGHEWTEKHVEEHKES